MVAFEPIGVVRTPFETPDEAPRQGVEIETGTGTGTGIGTDATGEIVLDSTYAPGLDGLEPGDRVDVLWIADEADRSTLRLRGGDRGVFSTRSQHRPNPICVSPCTVLAVEPPRLTVRGVDARDGSPVLDLKPTLR